MFTSRKRHQKEARDASVETAASSSATADDLRFSEMSDDELRERTKQILKEMDIKQIDSAMETMDKAKMQQLCYNYHNHQQKQQQKSGESAPVFCHQIKKSLEHKEEWKNLLESLSIRMSNNNVPWINEFGKEGGFQLLTLLLGKLLHQLGDIRSKSVIYSEDAHIQEEEYYVSCLLDAIKATRNCLNCQSGIQFLFRPGSRLCFKLIETLFMSSCVSPERFRRFHYGQIILCTLPLLFSIPFLSNDDISDHIDVISGRDLLSRELTAFADQHNVPRFACVVNCFRFEDYKITDKALCFINAFLSTTDEEKEWRVRILWRGELAEAGLEPLIPKIRCLVGESEKLAKSFHQFEEAHSKDVEQLKECFKNLQNDVNDLDNCSNMLLSSCKNSDCEQILLQLFMKLLLVSDRKYKRSTYFSIINKYASSVAFGDIVLGPETQKQQFFNGDLEEEFDKMERDDGIKRLNKRLDSAVEEKQEAVSLQVKYYEKIKEYQNECAELRKLVTNGTATAGQKTLPLPTVLDLPQPKEYTKNFAGTPKQATSAVEHLTGPGCPPPPPPPPPPPALLMPEHKRNKLAPTTATGAAPPPPPPPPPPSALRPDAAGPPMPPPPPPLGGLSALIASPELPDFLKKKCTKQPEVPMKKLPWNAAIIKPSAIHKASLWAQIDEKEVASEDVFEFLKAKFSATGKVNCLPVNVAKRPPSKAKTPLVIQDAKMLQALAILQGSCKLSFKRWRAAILEVDEKALNAELVDKLKSALPPLDMINRLKKCTEDEIQRMPEGEQFVATLSSINGLPIRLEAIHLKLCWAEALGELKSGITTVTEACEELLKSQGLRHFINLVLLVGNFMGRTKNSKDAFAFELSVLNKLVDTRDCDNSETLLHGIIRLLHRKFSGKFTTFALDDFHHVSKACRVDVSELSKAKIDQVRNSVEKVDRYLSTYKSQADNDHFNAKIGAFVKQTKDDLTTVDSLWENMERKRKRVEEYLCFDSKKYTMDRLFADVHAFKGHYQNARADVLKDHLKISDADGKDGVAQKTPRKPFKPIQPIATEAAKKAQERSGNKKELHLISTDGGAGSRGGLFDGPTPVRSSASTLTTPTTTLGRDVAGGDGGVIDKIEQMLEEGKYRMECQKRPFRVRRKGQPTVYVSGASTATTTADDSVKNHPTVDVVAVEEEEEEDDAMKKKEFINLPSSVDLLLRLRGLDGD